MGCTWRYRRNKGKSGNGRAASRSRKAAQERDESQQLDSRALDTLIALVERAGEVVTQRELISRVWPGVTVEITLVVLLMKSLDVD